MTQKVTQGEDKKNSFIMVSSVEFTNDLLIVGKNLNEREYMMISRVERLARKNGLPPLTREEILKTYRELYVLAIEEKEKI